MKISDILSEENIYDILEPEDCGPFDGGCVLVAQALQQMHGGEIVVLVNDRGIADHAAVKVGNTLIDYDGPLPADKFVKRFEKNELVNITGIRSMKPNDLPGATRNQSLVPKIVNLLSKKKKFKSIKEELSIHREVTSSDLKKLEYYADKVFARVGIDVEFTRHFLDRVNDERNVRQITLPELAVLFRDEYARWGKKIAQLGPDAEGVMKDMRSDINVPFALRWDSRNQELDLIAKTVMRKKNFKTPNQEFPVESKDQVRGKDRAKTVKPKPYAGSQPHPFRGKLVGGNG